MLSKFYLIDDNMYYFGGSDGSMKTGSQSIKDNTGDTYKFYFYTKDQNTTDYKSNSGAKLYKGAGVIGNQSNKLYYYGMLIQADDYKYQLATVNHKTFIVNSNGSIQHSAIDYKEDGDVLIPAKDAKFDTTDKQYKYNVTAGLGTSAVTDIDLGKFVEGIN